MAIRSQTGLERYVKPMTRDECYTGARVYYHGYGPGEIDGTMRINADGTISVRWDNGYEVDTYSNCLNMLTLCEDPFDYWVRQVRAGANADNNDAAIQR